MEVFVVTIQYRFIHTAGSFVLCIRVSASKMTAVDNYVLLVLAMFPGKIINMLKHESNMNMNKQHEATVYKHVKAPPHSGCCGL